MTPTYDRAVVERSEQTFEVNGQVYRSLDEVPQPLRDSLAAMLADRDGDGVPDLFEGGSNQVIRTTSSTQIFEVDGVEYSSIDEVPEADRARVAAAFERLTVEAGHEAGRPPTVPSVPAVSTVPSVTAAPGRSAAPPPIVTRAGWSGRARLLLAFMAVDAVAVAVVLWIVLR